MQLFRTDKKLTPSWDLVKLSVQLVQEHFWPLFYLSFLPGLAAIVGLILAGADAENQMQTASRVLIGIAIFLVGAIASVLTYPGFIIAQIQATHGEHPTPLEAYKAGLPRVIPFILMSLAQTVLVLIGLLLFIIPGLILIRGFLLAPYYLVDKKLGPIEALKTSFAESKPHAGWLWGVLGVMLVFALASTLVGKLPVVGYLLSIIVSYIYIFAPAIRYKEIARQPAEHHKAKAKS